MKKYTGIILLLTVLVLAGSNCFAEQFFGKITSNGINLRTDSNTTSQSICILNSGETVEVFSERYDWYKVRLPANIVCFVKKELLIPLETTNIKLTDAKDSPIISKVKTAKAQKDNINVRLGPGETSLIIGKVSQNEVVNVLDEKNGWYKINAPANSFGWVHKKFVEKVSDIKQPADPEAVIAQSQTQPLISQDKEIIEITGAVQPYGKVINRKATHKLLTGDFKIYLLQGQVETLNTLTYHKVKISGKISNQNNQKYPIITVDKLEALD